MQNDFEQEYFWQEIIAFICTLFLQKYHDYSDLYFKIDESNVIELIDDLGGK